MQIIWRHRTSRISHSRNVFGKMLPVIKAVMALMLSVAFVIPPKGLPSPKSAPVSDEGCPLLPRDRGRRIVLRGFLLRTGETGESLRWKRLRAPSMSGCSGGVHSFERDPPYAPSANKRYPSLLIYFWRREAGAWWRSTRTMASRQCWKLGS